jgi:hypothetical protein
MNNAVAAVTSTTPQQHVLQHPDMLRHILSFVGANQYRFVTPLNKDFMATYLQLFPYNKTTYYNASTIHHANICIMECPHSCCSAYATLCTSAARHGSLMTLQYLQSLNYAWNVRTCSMAAKYGHLDLLQYLHTNGCPWDDMTCSNAAENGHFELLQWARSNSCPWNKWTCTKAAGSGHLDILQWARLNGCPWDNETCSYAAQKGQLAVLQWAHDNVCPWDSQTFVGTAMG